MQPEFPTLRIGLAGFSHEQQEQLRAALAQAGLAAGPAWRLGDLVGADVLFINGGRARVTGSGLLSIEPAAPEQAPVQISMGDIARPVAIAQPFMPDVLKGVPTFDLGDPPSLRAVLEQLAKRMRPMLMRHALAAQLMAQDTTAGSGVFHVTDGRSLLAVVDARGDVSIDPILGPKDLDDAVWLPRPRPALEHPSHFMRCSLSHLMWEYANRTTRDVLPARYRSGPLFYRRPPRLPHRMLQDSHLLLMRELVQGPSSFTELQQRTKMDPAILARDLGALYLVGAITSNPKRAPQHALRRQPSHGPESSLPGGLASGLPSDLHPSSVLPQDARTPPADGDYTVAAPLPF